LGSLTPHGQASARLFDGYLTRVGFTLGFCCSAYPHFEEVRRMIATSPEYAVELLDRAFAQGDLGAVLSFYEEAAVVITEPGNAARGPEELTSFFVRAMQSGASAKQLKTQVIEADGVALFLSRWTLHVKDAPAGVAARTFTATTVFRKQPDGGWKILIDNPFGPSILGPE
jgi:ketosteroid isomerase-like protein